MSNVKYNLVEVGDTKNITLFYDGEMYVASHEHPNWDRIVELAAADDPEVVNLFDIPKQVRIHLQSLSERITIVNDEFLLDGDPMHNGLTTKVLEFLKEGLDGWKPLVAFLEKVLSNPSKNSQEQLYEWLDKNEFAITDDGNIVGYKGVNTSTCVGFDYASTRSGTASVNGVEQVGAIHQNIGDVVTMPRSAVNADANVGCSTGLHVSNFDYARSYGRRTLRVLVNPRDVVSVPNDSSFQKARCCRYMVDAEVDRNNKPVSRTVEKVDKVLPESDEYEEDYFPGVGTWVDVP